MNKKFLAFEYIRTILLTLLAVFVTIIIMTIVIQHRVYEEQDKIVVKNESIEYHLIGVLIEKNKQLELKYPKNYKINLKLGILYEIYKDFEKSEIEYKTACEKAPFDQIKPQYKLANLYIRLEEFDKAKKVMESIIDRANKKVLNYKAEIYFKLGDKYYDNSSYKQAIIMYEKSLSYYKASNPKKVKRVENSIASSYLYLAENYIVNMRISDAINALIIANSIVDAPIIKFKLALLMANSNPTLAYNYFEEVFKKEPTLINYKEYYKFLYNLSVEAKKRNQIALAKLYKYKAEKMKTYYEENVLSIQDVAIEYLESELILNKLLKKYRINIELKLRNTSSKELKSLYLNIDFSDNDGVFEEYYELIVTFDEPLEAGQLTPIINIRASKPHNKTDPKVKKINALVTVSKTSYSYKLTLANVEIKQTQKKKKPEFNLNLWIEDIKGFLPSFSR